MYLGQASGAYSAKRSDGRVMRNLQLLRTAKLFLGMNRCFIYPRSSLEPKFHHKGGYLRLGREFFA